MTCVHPTLQAEQLETQAGEWSRSVASACTTFRHARSGSEKQVTALQQALAALGSACALAAALQPGDEASQ